MADFRSSFDDDDLMNARMNRESRMNPPQSEPGMGDEDAWASGFDNDLGSLGGSDSFGGFGSSGGGFGSSGGGFGSSGGGFGSSGGGFGSSGGGFGSSGGGFGSSGGGFGSQGGGFGGGGNSWGSSFNGGGGSFQPNPYGPPFGNQMGQQQQSQNPEDKFFNALGVGFKGLKEFIKEFVGGCSKICYMTWYDCGKVAMLMSVIAAAISIALMFIGYKQAPFCLAASILSGAFGVTSFMCGYQAWENHGRQDPRVQEQVPMEMPMNDFPAEEPSFEDEPVNLFDDSDDEDTAGGFDDLDPFDLLDDEEEEDIFDSQSTMNNSLETLDVDRGMVTRSYLYEKIIGCLTPVNAKFDAVKSLDETSSDFDMWDAMVQKCGDMIKTGNSEEDVYLLSAREKLFYVSLEIQRVKWLKNPQVLADEIINMYKRDPESGDLIEDRKNSYALANTVGDKIFIKIMTGKSVMLSLKDTFSRVKDDILDTGNYLPVIIGIDQEGKVIWRDMKKINSMLIAGMPRSGKSWFVKSILAQMMFWMKPSELQFLLLDPKGDISDFLAIKTPHIRKFVHTDESILRELRWAVNVEGPRRKKLLSDNGEIDFWDFKRKHPEVEFPLLYVFIDEVVTLAERMDKETKTEFQELLAIFVSQLPALGMRLFMVPHVVKNQIISKTTTDLIPCRISVCGDASHIESTTGTKEREFPQKLANMGDMAVRFNNDATFFVHSAVLAPTNDGAQELFDFLARFWAKIEPESVEKSVMGSGSGNATYSSNSDVSSDINNNSMPGVPRKNITTGTKVAQTKSAPQVKISSADYESLKQKAFDDDDDDDFGTNYSDFDDNDNSLENLFG